MGVLFLLLLLLLLLIDSVLAGRGIWQGAVQLPVLQVSWTRAAVQPVLPGC
jgi:hypothetical protein